MFLNLFHGITVSAKLQKLSESLKKDFGVDLDTYEGLSSAELAEFAHDLEYKKAKIISESDFNSYYIDPEYTRTTLLLEAVRIILKEIHPKRKLKQKFQESQEVDETLDYKVHPSTSAAIDHDIDEDKERPDLYWRRHQWEEERSQVNHPVTVHDEGTPYSENPDNTDTIPSYAQNAQPVGGTAENEQQAGIYVAVMDPNRFLGDKEQKIMSIEPTVQSQNEVSPLTRKVSDVMVDAEQPVEGTVFEIEGNRDAALQGKSPKKVIAVYEEDDEINEEGKQEMTKKNEEGLVEGLGTLLEGELERAELVLATRDLVGRLQKMIEDLGKMGTDDIMPMVDGLRMSFSPQIAENFSTQAEQHIQTAADAIQSFKDTLDGEAHRLEGRISDEDAEASMNDMAMGGGMDDMSGDMGMEPELGGDDLGLGDELGGEESLDDMLGGDEAAASEEPLGRAKKESHVITIAGKKVRLGEAQLQALMHAMKITRKINALVEAENSKPKTVVVVLGGAKFRLNEYQIKSLLFAKNFNMIVESKKANVAKLSESQARMLKTAKALTENITDTLAMLDKIEDNEKKKRMADSKKKANSKK